MSIITNSHFGGNVILTRDSLRDDQPFGQTLQEIGFSNLRYPGGGVTEAQTWDNGGLDKMFGAPLEPGTEGYVLTLDETLSYAAEHGQSVSIVIPTFQFYNASTGAFDHAGFDRYIDALEGKLAAHPDTTISTFEIGNEYWGSIEWGGLSAQSYGAIANAEVPKVHAMIERLSDANPSWDAPGIGVQAGVQWEAVQNPDGTWTAIGPQESHAIINELSMETRGMIDTVFQHSYPEASSIAQNLNWAVRPMEVFDQADGFQADLHYAISEFNIGGASALGIDQGAAWIDAFSQAVDLGVDSFDHWGISYEWLSNKFYDTKFPPAESDDGTIHAIATPMGQIYDIAQSHLVGKSTLTDAQALESINTEGPVSVTGFGEDDQQIVFFHNASENDQAGVDLSGLPSTMHTSIRVLKPADSPHSPWFDESARDLHKEDGIADSRGDMHVSSQEGVQDHYTLNPGEMLVVVTSDADRDLVIEGAHNVTDPTNGLVDDLIVGGNGNDILRGFVGDDTIKGGGGKNVLSGGKGDDLLIAGDEGDVIFAEEGNDTVVGGKGDDTIVLGGRDTPSNSTVLGGEGDNLFLVGANANTVIGDFKASDHLGFGGAFEDADALRSATVAQGEDALITMPDGSQVLLTGQADQIEDLHAQVLDFMDPKDAQAITDSHLDDLTYDQLGEVFDDSYDVTPGEGAGHHAYYDDLETTAARLDITPDDAHDPDDPRPTTPPTDDGDEDDGWLPPTIPDDEDTPPDQGPWHDDDEQDQDSASGGACFVATAAYGDRLHPEVVALRAFRDRHLVASRAGRTFVRFYWWIGPKMAAHTQPHQWHARVLRRGLSLLVTRLRAGGFTQGR